MKKTRPTNNNSKLVYSTDRGRIKEPESAESTPAESAQQGGDNIVRIRRETSGRKGSAVTTVNGICRTEPELKALTKMLKRLCGSGGTLKNGVIEIQGDHREKVAAALNDAGFTVKMAGG